MIKLLAETKGSFQLHDLAHRGQMIRAHRPCVIENSQFIQARTSAGQIRIIAELKAEATDEDFVQYWKEAKGDAQFAIDAFLAEFGKEAVEAPKAKGKGRGKKAEDDA